MRRNKLQFHLIELHHYYSLEIMELGQQHRIEKRGRGGPVFAGGPPNLSLSHCILPHIKKQFISRKSREKTTFLTYIVPENATTRMAAIFQYGGQ